MAINPTISNVSIPQIGGNDASGLENHDVDSANEPRNGSSPNSGLAGDELMSVNVWGAGSKMLVDQRALSSQAMSAQDIVGLLIFRG
jgi:hypothetical protein